MPVSRRAHLKNGQRVRTDDTEPDQWVVDLVPVESVMN